MKVEINKDYLVFPFLCLGFLVAFLPFGWQVKSVFFIFYGLAAYFLHREPGGSDIAEKYSLLITGATVVTGLIVRALNLEKSSFWYDETITGTAVQAVMKHGVPELGSGMMYWRAFPHTYLSALSTSLLGYSDFALRFPSVLSGVATIFLTYKIAEEVTDRETAVIAAIFVAFSSWEIVWGRQARMYSLFQMLYITSILLILRAQQRKTLGSIAGATASFIISMLTHVTGYILPVLSVGYLLLKNPDKTLSRRKLEIIAGTGLLLGLISILYIDIPTLIGDLSLTSNHFLDYLTWLMNEITILLLLSIPGAAMALRDNRDEIVLILSAVIIPVMIYFFREGRPASRYLYFAIPFICIFASKYISSVSSALRTTKLRKALITAIFVAVVLAGGNFLSGDYQPGMKAPQVDYKSAYTYVEERKTPNQTVISGWTPPAIHYLQRKPDYALAGEFIEMERRRFNGTEKYSGSRLLHGKEDIKKVLKREKGWMVLHVGAWNGQRNEVRALIQERADKKTQYRKVSVWKWS